MPKINVEISAELHAKAKANPVLSISKLAQLGLEWAVHRYGNWADPAAIGAATAIRPEPGAQPPSPVVATAKPKRHSLDPVGDALKPWTEPRTGREWYSLAGFLSYLGVDRSALESVLDFQEDIDRDPDDNEILDRPAIERAFIGLPSKAYGSPDRYHAMNAWFAARDSSPATQA